MNTCSVKKKLKWKDHCKQEQYEKHLFTRTFICTRSFKTRHQPQNSQYQNFWTWVLHVLVVSVSSFVCPVSAQRAHLPPPSGLQLQLSGWTQWRWTLTLRFLLISLTDMLLALFLALLHRGNLKAESGTISSGSSVQIEQMFNQPA